jgi:hypothetical protein
MLSTFPGKFMRCPQECAVLIALVMALYLQRPYFEHGSSKMNAALLLTFDNAQRARTELASAEPGCPRWRLSPDGNLNLAGTTAPAGFYEKRNQKHCGHPASFRAFQPRSP